MTTVLTEQPINWDEIADLATSYADGFQRVRTATGLPDDVIVDMLLNMNIEKCPNCGWFTDSFELLADGEDDPDGFCDNCRGYDKKDIEHD